jgi:hypothetical protein
MGIYRCGDCDYGMPRPLGIAELCKGDTDCSHMGGPKAGPHSIRNGAFRGQARLPPPTRCRTRLPATPRRIILAIVVEKRISELLYSPKALLGGVTRHRP